MDVIVIVTFIITVTGAVIGVYFYLKEYLSRRKQESDLSLFFGSSKNAKNYLRNFIRTTAVDRPPDDEEDFRSTQHFANKVDLIRFFFRRVFKNEARLIFLVLADAGMGKTTFLINLFYKYSRRMVERNMGIRYVALGDPYADEYIEKYKRDGSIHNDGGKTILLLDAFDEDPKALTNYSERFNFLINKCRTFSKVIITSRTQFFPEESKEKFSEFIPLNDKANSSLSVAKKYIAPFTDEEIQTYIRKKYSRKFNIPRILWVSKDQRTIKLVNEVVYLNMKRRMVESVCSKATNLVARPMLLDHIDLILDYKGSLNYECEIYQALIQSWINRESKKQRNKHPDEVKFQTEMEDFVLRAAVNCYTNFNNGRGLFIEQDFLASIAADKSIELDKMDLSARSLLNRNSKGRFKFSHKTIFEYLLAYYDLKNLNTEEIIDYSSFDFALYIRNQLAIINILNLDSQYYLAFNDPTFYKKHNMHSRDALLKISSVIVINNSLDILRQLRHFECLSTVYFMDTANIQDERLSSRFLRNETIGYLEIKENKLLVLYGNDGTIISVHVTIEPIRSFHNPSAKKDVSVYSIK